MTPMVVVGACSLATAPQDWSKTDDFHFAVWIEHLEEEPHVAHIHQDAESVEHHQLWVELEHHIPSPTGSVRGQSRGRRILEGSEPHSNKDKVDKNYSSKVIFQTILKKLTLDKFYPEKISTNDVLRIIRCEENPKYIQGLSKHFLRNLMRANPRARNTEYGQRRVEEADTSDDDNSSSSDSDATVDLINPLDMITAVFLCADSFLQQVLMQKMAQCQFALPLLLPDSGKGNITFMLWAMRQIVKNWKLQENASSMEESLVSVPMPFISFIRVGECNVSKSKLLNSILSNEKHDFFVHRQMECGDIPRKCSDGLVELSMFCPCGKSKIDVFQTEFSVLNLRGDARDHLVQLEFLKAISNAMFIIFDNGELDVEDMSILANSNAQLFIITSQKENSRSRNTIAITNSLCELKIKSIEMKMFVLQWMQLQLNDLSRVTFSKLRDDYKKIYVNLDIDSKKNETKLEKIEELMTSSSLGLVHFIREIGQYYEATNSVQKHSVPKTTAPAYRKAPTLPAVAAELFLEGFPLELMDGDVGCIPIDWVTDVLKAVSAKFGRDPRVCVLTVLGVQSTGKSTLLNTMFGLQFAVSSGRCTRGAFMQLISIDHELKQELACDFILVIDTEGLKAPEMAKLDDSYEHDNELATVVIGLSDITLINLAMENVEEMKDVLQIVVHAFLRMTEVGKKTKCLFVHHNSGDVTAIDKNMRDKKCLIDQLNDMTVAAAKMEHKESTYSKFTDVMEHDVSRDNWYIPGLWHGTPPMASVSAAYSDQVFHLKQHLIDHIKKRTKAQKTLTDFSTWIGSIWEAVKNEKFIFSFKNSLVANAYNQLCIHYTGWEWEFRNDIISWTQEKNNYINNIDYSHLQNISQQLEPELDNEISKGGATLQNKIKSYFENQSNDVHLVEKYKEDFNISTNQLCNKLQVEALNKVQEFICRRQSGHSIAEIETQSKKIIGLEVCKLLQSCKNNTFKFKETQLEREFSNMWSIVVTHLPKITLKRQNVYQDMMKSLRNSKIDCEER
ncbi:interferon-induced very large GTPase 1-like [Lampetra fluviatilis]